MLAVHKKSAAAAEATLPTTGTAPLTRTVIVGSANEISAGDQMIGATPYTFSSWSDGSAGQHVITATTAIRPTRRRSRGPSTPVAKLSARPDEGRTPLKVKFDAEGSRDPDGERLRFSWNLNGDGRFGDSHAVHPGHTYLGHRKTNVRLRVSDGRGGVDTAAIVIRARR
jgi:PKD repeat protein